MLLITLAVIYVFNFTSVLQKETIEILYQVSPRLGRGKSALENAVVFSLNGKYELTSLKVVEDRDLKTNKYPHALWHLVSHSNSIPTKAIIYGVPVRGMQPQVAKLKPAPLKKNVPYVLLVEAGEIKGQTTFEIR